MGGHIARFDIALFARAMACEAPKVRAVININGNLAAMFLGVLHRKFLGGGRIGFGEMRAGDNHRAGGGDKGLVDIAFIQCVIGAIITVENQRELLVVTNAEDNQRCEPVFVRMHALRVDTFALQLLADEAAHMLVADAGDEAAFQPQSRRADGDIGR